MSILIKNQDMPKEGEKYLLEIRHDGTVYDAIGQRVAAQAVQFESPWHMVEEPPEPHKDVLVTGMEAINNSRVYKVMVNDNGTWRPTDYAPSIRWEYWMPIEPPKEDA